MKINKIQKILLAFLLLTTIYLLPVFVHAQNAPAPSRFVPCDGVKVPCDFKMLMQLVQNSLDFLVLDLALPLATITIIYAGFLYLTTAVSDKKSKAKTMLTNVVIGFFVLLAAWLIVRIIVTSLTDSSIPSFLQF